MEADPPTRQPSSAARGIVGILLAVVAVGLLARAPSTAPEPPVETPSATPSEPLPTDPPPDTPGPSAEEPVIGRGTWTTLGVAAPVDLLRETPAVWTGAQLVVGFSPLVAAFTPQVRMSQAWTELPPHPDGALQVRGVVQAAEGSALYVMGAKTCAGCPWEPSLHALDPVGATWARLPDAPGEPSPDREQVVALAGHVVVVRDRGTEGLEVVAYDPAAAAWVVHAAPPVGAGRWQAVAAGDALVVLGEGVHRGAEEGPWAFALDLAVPSPEGQTSDAGGSSVLDGGWRDVGAGMPLPDPHAAAAVWTGAELVLFGGSVGEGSPRGAVLSPTTGAWSPLPDPPVDHPLLSSLDVRGSLVGVSGVWDGEQAVFVGGLSTPVHIAWTPGSTEWEVRRSTRPRAGGALAWTGRQLLLWSGVDRRGPIVDLQIWPTRAGL